MAVNIRNWGMQRKKGGILPWGKKGGTLSGHWKKKQKRKEREGIKRKKPLAEEKKKKAALKSVVALTQFLTGLSFSSLSPPSTFSASPQSHFSCSAILLLLSSFPTSHVYFLGGPSSSSSSSSSSGPPKRRRSHFSTHPFPQPTYPPFLPARGSTSLKLPPAVLS